MQPVSPEISDDLDEIFRIHKNELTSLKPTL